LTHQIKILPLIWILMRFYLWELKNPFIYLNLSEFVAAPSSLIYRLLIDKEIMHIKKKKINIYNLIYLIDSLFFLDPLMRNGLWSIFYPKSIPLNFFFYTLPQKKATIALFFYFNSTFKCYRSQCYCKSMAIIALLKVLSYVQLLIALLFIKCYRMSVSEHKLALLATRFNSAFLKNAIISFSF
jgi:hypothetical protein